MSSDASNPLGPLATLVGEWAGGASTGVAPADPDRATAATYGICANPFLDREFRTVRFTMKIRVLGPDRFTYEQDAVLEIRQPPFHHTDTNTLQRVPV